MLKASINLDQQDRILGQDLHISNEDKTLTPVGFVD